MRLDEKALRRPDFDESNVVPVTMPCGETFYLPRPILYLEPVFRDGQPTQEARLSTDDPEFDRLKEAVQVAVSARDGDGADLDDAVVRLAVHLLTRTYDLTDAHLGRIFRVPASGSGSAAWMGQVVDVAHGREVPKPSAVG